MFRPWAVLLACPLIFSACGSEIRSKEKVQQAIVARLQTNSGLDLNALDVTTTSVSFDQNKAYATVAFHLKGDPSVNTGMMMRYTLENRAGSWVVVNVGDSQGHSVLGQNLSGSSQLPPGHPNAETLPPGHPPLNDGANGQIR